MTTLNFNDFELFQSISSNLQDELEKLPVTQLNKGDYILKKGVKNYALHLLIEGTAEAYLHEGEVLKIIKTGEIIGEISLIDQQLTTASIMCLTPCEIIAIDERLIWRLVNDSHQFTINLLHILVNRCRGLNTQVEDSIEQQQQLEHDANIDALTGLFNRGWLDAHFSGMLERHRYDKQAFSYLMIDIDHFKAVNDNYGHLVGDLILKNTAEVLHNSIRTTDYAIRYGGEEMAILLAQTHLENARNFAERLRQKIENNVTEYEPGKYLSITVSIGLSTLSQDETATTLIKLADDALYYAKEHGRNQVRYNSGRDII